MQLSQLQELFVRTFDLSPVCSLEMGWHLFGENYDRGLLLVKMRQQLRTHAIRETNELPDHLTSGLRLVAVMQRAEGAYFVEAVVLPALQKMIAALEGKQNPYQHVLLAARNLLRADFPEIQFATAGKLPELHVLA
jgi:nitrate reductase delta subunit